jgi:hypothetical protein
MEDIRKIIDGPIEDSAHCISCGCVKAASINHKKTQRRSRHAFNARTESIRVRETQAGTVYQRTRDFYLLL